MKLFFKLLPLLIFSGASYASTITLNALNSGWYYDSGVHNSNTQPNISAGVCVTCLYSGETRNFFLFDLSSISENIVSAELRITSGNYVSNDPFEIFSLFDVTSDPSILPTNTTQNLSLFDDLGSGQEYGSYQVQQDSDTVISIMLNSIAIEDINNTNSLFAIGGAVTSLDNDLTRTQYLFGGTHLGEQTRELIITTVPVPGAFWLFLSSLPILFSCLRKINLTNK